MIIITKCSMRVLMHVCKDLALLKNDNGYLELLEIKPCGLGSRIQDIEAE